MKRRDFLFGTLASVIYVSCAGSEGGAPPADPPVDPSAPPPPPPAAPLTPTSSATDSDRVFPQGLVSGDPRPDRVVLWTRVEPASVGKAETDDIDLELVVAKDEALTDLVTRTKVTALASADHAIKVVPTGLAVGTRYFYRFEASGTTTQVGRTKTAPDPAADVPVKFAFCACEDYIGRYYHSWRALLEEKADLDFVLFLGDYIYESVNDARFQSSGSDRAIQLPDGMDTSKAQDKSRIGAATLADYRALYKTYRKDPLLKEIHRLYPFIVMWDDHEFADDCWQDHSTSFDEKDPVTGGFTDEKNTPRRMAANRAFFEYQPLDVQMTNLPFPFDIKIYRQFSWGKHVELFLTDQRAYRADHLIPEGPADLTVGKFVDNTSIGSRYFVRKAGFDPREANVKPSMLGDAQKAWFVDAVKKSKATWKIWGSETQVYEMALELGKLPNIPAQITYTVYVNVDQWDGFRSERKEILQAFADGGVSNLLVCTGDIHSFYASELHPDFGAPGAKPIGVEYVTAGISSASLAELIDKFVPPGSALRPVVAGWSTGGAEKALLETNPHMRFADTNAYGFALATIDGTKAVIELVQLGNPTVATYGGVTARKKFVTDVGTNKVRLL